MTTNHTLDVAVRRPLLDAEGQAQPTKRPAAVGKCGYESLRQISPIARHHVDKGELIVWDDVGG
jgi:hypothetical protein